MALGAWLLEATATAGNSEDMLGDDAGGARVTCQANTAPQVGVRGWRGKGRWDTFSLHAGGFSGTTRQTLCFSKALGPPPQAANNNNRCFHVVFTHFCSSCHRQEPHWGRSAGGALFGGGLEVPVDQMTQAKRHYELRGLGQVVLLLRQLHPSSFSEGLISKSWLCKIVSRLSWNHVDSWLQWDALHDTLRLGTVRRRPGARAHRPVYRE